MMMKVTPEKKAKRFILASLLRKKQTSQRRSHNPRRIKKRQPRVMIKMLKKRIEQVRFVAIMLIIELKSKQSLISLKAVRI